MHTTLSILATLLLVVASAARADDAPEGRFAVMSPDAARAYEADTLRRITDLALIPPVLNTSPLPQYDYNKLDYGMTIGIERTPKGRLWACWVAGGDSPKAFFVLATSDDDGETWSKPRLVVDAHSKNLPRDRSVLVGNLWTDPLGRLWLFFDQSMEMFDGRAGVWAAVCDDPDAENPVWSTPRRIWHGVTLNKPTVLASGEWMLPISLDQRDGSGPGEQVMFGPFKGLFKELDPFRGANVFVSADKGATWQRRGAVRFPNPDWHEHMIVERKDKSLWMLARTAKGIMQSTSTDGGRTWAEPTEPPGIRQPNARFHVRRLASGRLLLVKHGDRLDAHEGRVQLSGWLSDDDGATWQGGLVLDERKGISYPDGFQAPDGTIYISYDRNRATDGEILLARFTEDDVLAKRLVSPKSKLKMLISRPLAKAAASPSANAPTLLPARWNPKAAADAVLARLIRVSGPAVQGAHDAEFVCVGDKAYVVEHDNDIQPGHGAGKAMYCVLTIVNLKTLAVEKIIPLAKSGEVFENVTLPEGMCFVPRIIRKDEHTLRTYFCSQPPKEQAVTWYRDFDLRTLTFEKAIHKAKLKTAAGVFDMEPRHFHADAAAQGFAKPPFRDGLYIFDSFKEFDGRRYVAINNFLAKQNALAWLHDDLETFEIVGHYNEPQSEQLSESAVNRLPDGTWMAICRNDKGNYHFTTSKDGRTWTAGQPRPFVPNGLNSKPTFDRFGGVYYLGWQENTKVGECNRSVFNVDISRDGQTWERKYRFETPNSFQYPTFHEHQGTIWLTVTQSDHKGSTDRIMFGRLEDVGQGAPQSGQEAESAAFDPARRLWQGIPGLERTAKGRLYVSWFTGGPKEPAPGNTVVVARSDDGGKTLSAPQALALPLSDGTRCYDPCLWIDPRGRLWYLFNRSVKDSTQHGVYARICDDPDAGSPVWGKEFRVGFDTPFCFRMNKPIVLSTGEWIMPVTHALQPLAGWAGFDPGQVQGVGISTDEGKTWALHGAVKTPAAGLENMIVELRDGRLWMLIRTAKVLWESHSADKGRTWTEAKPTTISTPHSRFFIRRLASGNLLLVNHYKFTGRSHLTARVSTDDGVTWNEGLLLDERGGETFPNGVPGGVSYPDGVQDKDGLIWITYDRDRQGSGEILLATFREEDVAAGRDVSGKGTLRQMVNRLEKPAELAAVIAADDARVAAFKKPTAEALEKIFSSDLHYAHSTGVVDTKPSFINVLTSGKTKYVGIDYENREWSFPAPGIALMTGRVRIQAVTADAALDNLLSFLAVWRLEEGRWRFLAWQSCRMNGRP